MGPRRLYIALTLYNEMSVLGDRPEPLRRFDIFFYDQAHPLHMQLID